MPLIERIVNFSRINRTASHMLFWMLLAVVFLNRYDGEDYLHPHHILYRHVYYIGITMLAGYFLAYVILPMVFGSRSYFVLIGTFLAGSYLICVLSRVAVVHVLEPLTREPGFSQESLPVILTDLRKLFTHYFTLSFSAAWIFPFFKLVKDQYMVQQRTLLVEKQQTESELKTLKAQLNPHFLFNTLNNIYSLSILNSPETSKAIAGLSEILDHILYRCNAMYVPLSSEIKLISNYTELERLRYDKRVDISFEHRIAHDAEIAPLILLSLVENAFKHGAGSMINDPFVNIELILTGHDLHFKVSNACMPSNGQTETGIGLDNISKQLELIYPGRHVFNASNNDGLFVVLLTIDLNKQQIA